MVGTVLVISDGGTATRTWNYTAQDAIGSTRRLWDEDEKRVVGTTIPPLAGSAATQARRSSGDSRGTIGTTKPGCITPPTGSIVPIQEGG